MINDDVMRSSVWKHLGEYHNDLYRERKANGGVSCIGTRRLADGLRIMISGMHTALTSQLHRDKKRQRSNNIVRSVRFIDIACAPTDYVTEMEQTAFFITTNYTHFTLTQI
jgi:hypothetical protein